MLSDSLPKKCQTPGTRKDPVSRSFSGESYRKTLDMFSSDLCKYACSGKPAHTRTHIHAPHIHINTCVCTKLKKSDIVLSIISNHYNMNAEINNKRHFRKFTDIKG